VIVLPGDALYLSMVDTDNLLGTCSAHPILLDDALWPTVEHYVQAVQFVDDKMKQKVRLAADPSGATRLGKSWFKQRLTDWNQIRRVYMTRGIYTKCRTYQEVSEALLETGDRHLVEKSLYDYYWGCGRDLRGKNNFGEILMDVRRKLREEQARV